MTEFANEIDALFDSAPNRADECGLLAGEVSELAQHGVSCLFIATADGCVLTCYPPDAMRTVAPIALEIAQAHRASPSDLMIRPPTVPGQPTTLAIVIAMSDEPAFVGLTGSESEPPELTALQIHRLHRTAAAALRLVRVSDEIRMLRARSAQLESELWTIRQSNAEAVTWLLNEREEHMQAKRLHIVQLESEVKQRSSALREALRRAEAANHAKSEFLSNVSHEIRTPMNAILGFCETLLGDDVAADERLDALHTIRRNGQYLLEIINDILDLSKIEAGKLTTSLVKCSPARELGEVLALMRPRAEEKNLSLVVCCEGAIPEMVLTDPLRLRQILINLVGNAIKFTNKGRVEVRLALADGAAKHNATLRFDVVDSGIGIAPEHLSRLFTPFGQADSAVTRQFGGTGLGLTICKRLAAMLGGDVTVVSALGAGSTFSVSIDVGAKHELKLVEGVEFAVPHEATAPAETAVVRLDGIRVLLAEDGADNQRLIRAFLQKAGAHVTIVANGREAVDRVRAARGSGSGSGGFNVLLMDMQMPILDGYAAASLLRADGVRTPIIALTAHAMQGDREKCLAAGCTEFLTKPIGRRILLDMISRVVSNSGTPTGMHAVPAAAY